MSSSDYASLLQPFPRERAQLLPLLIAVQAHDGWLGEAALSAIAHHIYVPESEVFGVATSYSELRFEPPVGAAVTVCTGLSCLLAGAAELSHSLTNALADGWHVEDHPCRFRCADAPVASIGGRYVTPATADAVLAITASGDSISTPERTTRPARAGEVRRLLARCGRIDPASIDDAVAAGAYDGLVVAQALAPDAIVQLVEDAGLLGRGGAYFPVAAKWSGARAYPGPRYLVVNAEEGEPGVFKDRHLIEGDPHLLVEGIFIAARAIEAEAVYVYVNGEADAATERLSEAIEQARARGRLGDDAPQIEIRRGAGGYVCGEESVILSSIEGERAVPRLRPPFPVEAGLFGRPTVINNVESLCNLPGILRDGAAAFRAYGTPEHPGTKLVCLSGTVRDPGVCMRCRSARRFVTSSMSSAAERRTAARSARCCSAARPARCCRQRSGMRHSRRANSMRAALRRAPAASSPSTKACRSAMSCGISVHTMPASRAASARRAAKEPSGWSSCSTNCRPTRRRASMSYRKRWSLHHSAGSAKWRRCRT